MTVTRLIVWVLVPSAMSVAACASRGQPSLSCEERNPRPPGVVRIDGPCAWAPAPGSLLVVDGTAIGPIESKSSRATLQRLSRADLIESITVLKASSTVAPYGPAGSKGVLLVVTKAARAPH
jgi:hypothetical protein